MRGNASPGPKMKWLSSPSRVQVSCVWIWIFKEICRVEKNKIQYWYAETNHKKNTNPSNMRWFTPMQLLCVLFVVGFFELKLKLMFFAM